MQASLSFQHLLLVKRHIRGNRPGTECSGVFLFIKEFDLAHPDIVIVEEEFLRFIDRMAKFDFPTNVRCGNFIDGALETDRGIVINHPLVTDKEDFIQLGFREPSHWSVPLWILWW